MWEDTEKKLHLTTGMVLEEYKVVLCFVLQVVLEFTRTLYYEDNDKIWTYPVYLQCKTIQASLLVILQY